jgi:hypothetical protein
MKIFEKRNLELNRVYLINKLRLYKWNLLVTNESQYFSLN